MLGKGAKIEGVEGRLGGTLRGDDQNEQNFRDVVGDGSSAGSAERPSGQCAVRLAHGLDDRLAPVRQRGNEIVRVGRTRGRLDLFTRRAGHAVGDAVARTRPSAPARGAIAAMPRGATDAAS